MGWNSWNHFGCDGLNENLVEQTASALASTGMKAAGYVYVNLDDCWMAGTRDATGNLIPDPLKFPNGIPALVNYVHGLGLKFGLYEDAGTATCAGRPGSLGHYSQDAATFASWGIDFIKVDWCNTLGLDPATQYTLFAQALKGASPNIVLSICDWGTALPWNWAPSIANLWRTTPDIHDNWAAMINNTEATSAFAASAQPGAWNDPDLLEVGNGGMTDAEYRTHISLWSMLAAPLIAGNDVTAMSAATLSTLTNAEVISIDQDSLGKQGIILSDNGSGLQTWVRQVSDGTAVALVNLSGATATVTFNFGDIGLGQNQYVAVRDLWAHADLGTYSESFSGTIHSHDVLMLKLTGVASIPLQAVYQSDSSANTFSGGAVVQPCPSTGGSSCLDGSDVTNIGGNSTSSITINGVQADTSGSYYLTVYAAVQGTGSYFVDVNGGAQQQISVAGTSAAIPATTGAIVALNAGYNSISFSNPNTEAPDLDHIVISKKAAATSGFNIVYPTPDVTIGAPGQSGTALITLVPTNGFSGTISIQCSLPPTMIGASCQGATVSLSGTTNAAISVVITTTAASSATLQRTPAEDAAVLLWRAFGVVRSNRSNELLTLLVLPVLSLPRSRGRFRRKWLRLWFLVVFIAINATGVSGCSGGLQSTISTPTQPGRYVITVNATSGTLSQSTKFAAVVQ